MLGMQSDRLALRACRLFESTDVDDTRERISSVLQDHALTSAGREMPVKSHMDYLRLPGAALGTIAFGKKNILTPPLENYYLLIFCLNGQAELRTSGTDVTISNHQGIVVNESHVLQGQFSQDCEQFIFRLDRDYVSSYLGRPGAKFYPRVDLNNPRLSPWLSLLRLVTTNPTMLEMVRSQPGIAREFTSLLTQTLVEGQELTEICASSDSVCPRSVHRAIAFMEGCAVEPITLDDIAKAAGVPPRTLQEAFHRFRDTSPMRYLRNLRLEMARSRLISCAPEVKVTSVALECGINHFGRFSREYAMRFGESPSATLRNRRR
jgi:AraC-like DNA-binding protein